MYMDKNAFNQYLLTSKVETGAVPYPTLSPVHVTTHHSGLTILMCVVHDIHQGEMELAWISSGTRGTSPAAYNLFQSVDGIQSAMSLISVASSEWTSYTCFVSHRVSDRLTHRHYAGLPKETTGNLYLFTVYIHISNITFYTFIYIFYTSIYI